MSTELPIGRTVRTFFNRELTEVRVQLTREAQTSRVPDITTETGWLRSPYVGSGKLQGAEVDIVKCLVINAAVAACFVFTLCEI
jgi:tRNA nucleotidyltransferase (CCA-adding enzyme)